MKKTAAVITLISCIAGVGFCFYWIIDGYSKTNEYERISSHPEIFWLTVALIPFASGIYYIIATKFGSEKSVLADLEKENEIIKKQIEKKELLIRLENLEKK